MGFKPGKMPMNWRNKAFYQTFTAGKISCQDQSGKVISPDFKRKRCHETFCDPHGPRVLPEPALTFFGGSDAPKPAAKKGDRSESDFSVSGMVKEVEEMQKAGQKAGPAPEKGAPAPAPAPAEPKN
jgi:hypothetical protein